MAAIAAPSLAHAQGMTESQPAKIWLGGQLGLSPIGTFKAGALGTSISTDAATAFEIGGRAEFEVMPFLSIGFAPSIMLNVKDKDADRSGSQLDLPLRLAVGGVVAPKIRLYGFAAPGYTIRFPPSDSSGNSTHPSGFMIGFGGGVGFRVAPRFSLNGELGYQFRFVSETDMVGGQSVEVSGQFNYLTFTIAAVAGL
jgi:outer membrane protein with beta-barrel domain